MAIAFRTAWHNATSAAPCNITIAGASGDYLIGAGVNDNGTGAFSWTAGWSKPLAEIVTNSFDGQVLGIASKFSDGTETTVAIFPDFNTVIGAVCAFTGVDTTTPLDVTPVSAKTDSGGASPFSQSASITPVTNGCQIVAIFGMDNSPGGDVVASFATTVGTTGAWTIHKDISDGSFENIAIASCNQTTAGAITVTATGTLASSSGARALALIALRPLGGGGGGGNLIVPSRRSILSGGLSALIGGMRG